MYLSMTKQNYVHDSYIITIPTLNVCNSPAKYYKMICVLVSDYIINK